jgi:hypothetical protein
VDHSEREPEGEVISFLIVDKVLQLLVDAVPADHLQPGYPLGIQTVTKRC